MLLLVLLLLLDTDEEDNDTRVAHVSVGPEPAIKTATSSELDLSFDRKGTWSTEIDIMG